MKPLNQTPVKSRRSFDDTFKREAVNHWLSATDKTTITDFANSFTKGFPESKFNGATKNFDFLQWAEDSHALAVKYSYAVKENAEPSATYVKNGQRVCRSQIALAGYRLANLLNDIWK